MIRRTIPYNPTGSTYCLNFQIKSTHKDFGFFDTYEPFTGTSNIVVTGITVTGYSNSRLIELRKYVVIGGLSDIYVTSTDPLIDGLDLTKTITGVSNSTYVYYVGNITYNDIITDEVSKTHFMFNSSGLSNINNFDELPYIKLEEKQNMVENPNISKDVKIVRQEIPVFEQSIRLRAVGTLNDILVYGGGKFFTVHNNT